MALKPEHWKAIRDEWEYSPEQPSLSEAAARAASKWHFKAPSKSSVKRHIDDDAAAGSPWVRKGSLAGINQAAHRKADALVDGDGNEKPQKTERNGAERNGEQNGVSAQKAQASREESEDARAQVLVRHRGEWKQVAVLRQEALKVRATDPGQAFDRAKLAKITAEMTKIQQEGERKAWGLDDLDFDPSKLSDAELEKAIKGM